jgi:hypothetical protein
MNVTIGYDRNLYEDGGIKHQVTVDLKSRAMSLFVGATGQGKTYATRYFLANLVKSDPAARITIIDVKNFDFFPDFSDCSRCYGADTALIGIKRYADEYGEIVKLGRTSDTMPRRVLLVDEWAALNSMAAFEKKKSANDTEITAKESMAIVSRILMTGRAYSHSVLIGCQRAQSELFPAGSRDNFGNILHMGNFSKEQRLMLAPNSKDEISDDCGVGQGYLIQQGKKIRRILIPEYNVNRANELIRGALQD